MNAPSQAASATPLHLYDYTHGQRRLTLWREPDLHGHLAVYASIAVPIVDQLPGEPPETLWREVATGRSSQPSLVIQHVRAPFGALGSAWRLMLDSTGIPLAETEAETIAAFLGIKLPAGKGGEA